MTQAIQKSLQQNAEKATSGRLSSAGRSIGGRLGKGISLLASNVSSKAGLFEKFLNSAGRRSEGTHSVPAKGAGKEASAQVQKKSTEAAQDGKKVFAKGRKEEEQKLKEPATKKSSETDTALNAFAVQGEVAPSGVKKFDVASLDGSEMTVKAAQGEKNIRGTKQSENGSRDGSTSDSAAKDRGIQVFTVEKPQAKIEPVAEKTGSTKKAERKEEGKATVVDLRKGQSDGSVPSGQGIRTESEAKSGKAKADSDTLSFDLVKSEKSNSSAPATKQIEKPASFASTLDEALKNHIVKQTGIILKNDTAGEIRLTLKPENLGRVRIRIELEDNRIAGRIFVENETVRNVFEQNMAALDRAFSEGGFELGSLNVSVGEKRRGDDSSGGLKQRSSLLAVSSIEEQIPAVADSLMIAGTGEERLVNLFV